MTTTTPPAGSARRVPGSRPPGRPSDREAAPRWLLPAVWLAYLVQVAWWWSPGRDALAYLSIARGLAQGELARLGSPHLYYAPGYPLLASPTFLAGDRPFLLLSLLQLVLAIVASLGILRWMRRHAGAAAPWLTALALVNTSLWSLYRATLAEIAFLACLVWTAEALAPGADGRRRAPWAGALLLALAVLTRQAGLALVAGLGVCLLLAWRRGELPLGRAVGRGTLLVLPALAVFLLVQWHDQAMAAEVGREGSRYLAQARDGSHGLGAQLLEGVRLRMAETGRLLLPGMHKAYAPAHAWWHVNSVLYGLLALGLGWGWWRAARGTDDVLLQAVPFYVLLYVVWPFDQGTRFFAPLLPVLVLALWHLLGTRPLRSRRRLVVVVLLLAHAAVALGGWVRSLEGARWHDRWPLLDRVVAAVGAERDAVGAPALDRREALMLQLALDRPLVGPGDPPARWLVLDAEADVPDGYEARPTIGAWRLARRVR